MDWKRRVSDYKITNGRHPEKDWADSPCTLPAYVASPEELEKARLINKERKQALTRSSIHFRSEDDYDKKAWYTSRTKEVHVPLQLQPEPLPRQHNVWEDDPNKKRPGHPPGNTETTWLRREVSELGVRDMPNSGAAEYPNYVAMVPPSPREVAEGLKMNKARKNALSRSSVHMKESHEVPTMYTSQTKADFPGQVHPTEVHRVRAEPPQPWNRDAKHVAEEEERNLSPTRRAAYENRRYLNDKYKRKEDIRVPELPESGCAENPTYLLTQHATAEELQKQKLINAQRKKALTSSNIEIGTQERRRDLNGTYTTELLFSQHHKHVVNKHAERFPTLMKESRAKGIHGTMRMSCSEGPLV